MNDTLQFMSENQIIKALANLFGLFTGIVLLWKGSEYVSKFIRDVIATSVRTAIFKIRFRLARIYIIASKDIFVFGTHLLIRVTLIVTSLSGLLLTSITSGVRTDEMMKERFFKQNLFGDFESYRRLFEIADLASAVVLIILMILSMKLTLSFITAVQKLRRRWRKRGRIKDGVLN